MSLVLGKSGGDQVSSAAAVADTNWHHVAVTKAGSVVVFYVDAVAYPAPAYNPGPFTFGAPAYIGAWFNPFGQVDNSFYGAIDELAVYSRGLAAAEIQAIFTAGSVGKCPPPPPTVTNCVSLPPGAVSWWRGESNAMDSTGSSSGKMIGGATFAPGKVQTAFEFNGTDGCTVISNSAWLNPTGPFSVVCWVKARGQQFSPDGQFLIVDKSHRRPSGRG